MSDEGYINQVHEDINHKMEEMRELQRKLDKSMVIRRVFPEAFSSGKVTLQWKGFRPNKQQLRGLEPVSFGFFCDRVSLKVIKGNGAAFSADTEQALELLSEGIGPKPLVECLQAIKARHSRTYPKPEVRTRAFKKRRDQ